MRKLKVATLCDGISCGQYSLHSLGIDYDYVAVEPNEKCKRLVKNRFPDTIQRDYVQDVTGHSLCEDLDGTVDILMISAPCQDISVQGKGRGFATVNGVHITNLEDYLFFKNRGYKFTRSATFWECIRVYRELLEINPDLIVINENVTNKKWEGVMLDAFNNARSTIINSSNFLPQNRRRNYITNFPIQDVIPTGMVLGDIIPGAVTGAGYHGVWEDNNWAQKLSLKKGNMAKCITTWVGSEGRPGTKFYVDEKDNLFPFDIEHLELLQGLHVGYTDMIGITEADRHHMIGNCWTIPVIVHILKSALPFVLQFA